MISCKPIHNALALAVFAVCASNSFAATLSPIASRALIAVAAPTALSVTNCEDSGVGSLRDAFASAVTGDIIDLTSLSCSTISLRSGLEDPIETVFVDIVANGNVSIERAANSGPMRLINHTNAQDASRLGIVGLTLTGGLTTDALGGACVFSSGDLVVMNSTVSGCKVESDGTKVLGGAIHAENYLDLEYTNVVDNSISTTSASTDIRGGGVFGYSMTSLNSYIGRNRLVSPNTDVTHVSIGGGLFTNKLWMRNSTVAANDAHVGGGIGLSGSGKYQKDSKIINSTISGNSAETAGGIYAGVLVRQLQVYNSTVAYNSATDGGGARLNTQNVAIVSSIVSANTGGDLASGTAVTLTGSHDLIGTSQPALPGDTILSSEPKLGPLSTNGGFTPTRTPLSGSPAIDNGVDPLGLGTDQRGTNRTKGSAPDIGAVEFIDFIFRDKFEDVS